MLSVVLVVDVLKREAIHEYEKLVSRLEKGYFPEYRYILDLISFINLGDEDEAIKQYFLNATGFLHFGK